MQRLLLGIFFNLCTWQIFHDKISRKFYKIYEIFHYCKWHKSLYCSVEWNENIFKAFHARTSWETSLKSYAMKWAEIWLFFWAINCRAPDSWSTRFMSRLIKTSHFSCWNKDDKQTKTFFHMIWFRDFTAWQVCCFYCCQCIKCVVCLSFFLSPRVRLAKLLMTLKFFSYIFFCRIASILL